MPSTAGPESTPLLIGSMRRETPAMRMGEKRESRVIVVVRRRFMLGGGPAPLFSLLKMQRARSPHLRAHNPGEQNVGVVMHRGYEERLLQ